MQEDETTQRYEELSTEGLNFLERDEYDAALNSFTESLRLQSLCLDPTDYFFSNTLANIGGVYEKQNNYDEALTCYIRILENNQEIINQTNQIDPLMPIICHSIAKIYYERRNNLAEAFRYLEEAKQQLILFFPQEHTLKIENERLINSNFCLIVKFK